MKNIGKTAGNSFDEDERRKIENLTLVASSIESFALVSVEQKNQKCVSKAIEILAILYLFFPGKIADTQPSKGEIIWVKKGLRREMERHLNDEIFYERYHGIGESGYPPEDDEKEPIG